MAKKKKKKDTNSKPCRRKDGVRMVEREMQDFLKRFSPSGNGLKFNKDEQEILYIFHFKFNMPIADCNQKISSTELKYIGSLVNERLEETILEHDGKSYSLHDINLLYCYFSVMNWETIRPERRFQLWKHIGSAANIKLEDSDLVDYIFLHLFKTITSISNFYNKIYTLSVMHSYVDPKNPHLYFNLRMKVCYAAKKKIRIDGVGRLVYRLILPKVGNPWFVEFDVTEFFDHKGEDRRMIPVYIQSHALKRLMERLDLLDEEAINYNLFENISRFPHFYNVNSYILIPFILYGIKVGYFYCQIVDDCFVIRTFLFVTHATTPEGDKLKEICGLGWNDIEYWKIDRLSTFMNVDQEVYPRLSAMFEEAGCGDLFKLHNEKFTTEAMQTANLDGLRDYIKSGKQEVADVVLETI